MYLSLVQLLCYCIGYTSNNDWSTSIIPLDQYQEKLQERRREWEASQPVEPEDRREIDRLTRVLQERELQEERREKEHVRTRLQQQLQRRERQLQQAQQQGQEREREIQQGREQEQDLQRQLQERERQAGEREQDLQQQLQSINSIYNIGISWELSNTVELVIKFAILLHFASVILPIVIIETSNIIPAYRQYFGYSYSENSMYTWPRFMY